MSTHIMTTRSRAHNECQFFCRLPPELRIMVWEHAIDLLGFTWYELEKEHLLQKMITPLWSVNHESRETAIRHSGVKPLGLYKIILDNDYGAFDGVYDSVEYNVSQCFQIGGYALFTVPRMCHGKLCKYGPPIHDWLRNRGITCLLLHEREEDEHQLAAYDLIRYSPIKEALQNKTQFRGLFFLDLEKFRSLTSQKCLPESAHLLATRQLKWSQVFKVRPDMIASLEACSCMAQSFRRDADTHPEYFYSWSMPV